MAGRCQVGVREVSISRLLEARVVRGDNQVTCLLEARVGPRSHRGACPRAAVLVRDDETRAEDVVVARPRLVALLAQGQRRRGEEALGLLVKGEGEG